MKTIKQLAQDAIEVQDACNGFAVANAYGKTLDDLRNALKAAGEPTDTDALNTHPVNRLWVSKLHDLAGMGLSDMDRYAAAYNWCTEQL